MRSTLHLVSARDYLAYAGIYRERRIGELQRQLSALGEEADLEAEGERLAALAAERPRARPELLARARPAEAGDRGPTALVRLVRALRARRPDPRTVGLRVAVAHGRRDLRSCSDLARRGRRAREMPPRSTSSAATWRRSARPRGADISQWTGLPLSVLRAGLERLELRSLPGRARSRALRPPARRPPAGRHARTRATPPALRQPRAEPRRSPARHLGRAPGEP